MATTTMIDEDELNRLRAEIARVTAERDAATAERDAATAERDAATAERDAVAAAKAKLESKVSKLEHKVDELLRKIFGRSSEKVDPAQLLLEFATEDGKESAALPTAPHVAEAPDGEARSEAAAKERKKKGHGWGKTPKDLPRKKVEIWPSEDALVCDRCGEKRTSIGAPEITERYDFEPRSVFVVETIRHRCRCPRCQDGTVIAPLPPPPVGGERGRADAGLLAQIAVAKFNDHLPLNRQSEIFAREGVHLSRSLLCDYVHGTAELLGPIAKHVLHDVLSCPVVGLDETGVRVVFNKKDPKHGTRNARIWVYRGLRGEVYFTIVNDGENPLNSEGITA